MEVSYKLENWCLTAVSETDGTAILRGNVWGNPQRRDGAPIMTSFPVGKRNGCVVTASGSEYELGSVKPEYEARYPNAKIRLMASLPDLAEVK